MVMAMDAASTSLSHFEDPAYHRGLADLAAALEMIHTYSLIHDDLPALDNDDLRRGKPTCHIIFGEAIAILAGDALQTLALQSIATLPTHPQAIVSILNELLPAISTGVGLLAHSAAVLPPGMIGGQVVDLESERVAPTLDTVMAIHQAKTGALIRASLIVGAIYSSPERGLPEASHQLLSTFGQKIGLAFQIVDDVLDITEESAQLGKTAGKDEAVAKATWPGAVGVEQSLVDAQTLISEAFAALEYFGHAASRLKALATHLIARRN